MEDFIKLLNEVNQKMKRYNPYYYNASLKSFECISSTYINYKNEKFNRLDIKNSFFIYDPKLLFSILKEKKLKITVEFFEDDKIVIYNDNEGIELPFVTNKILDKEFKEIRQLTNNVLKFKPILSNKSKLYFDDNFIKDNFDTNDISQLVKDIDDHSLFICEYKKDILNVKSEFADLNINENKFLILENNIINKLKLLKADKSFFRFFENEGIVVFDYGVLEKEQFLISARGVTSITS